MLIKVGFLYVILLVGSYAFPVKDDMSIFFDHTDPSARIVGGTIADRVPYMVALTSGINVRRLICGASLVTTRHVMTAGHCVVASLTLEGVLASSLRGHVDTDRYTGGTWYTITRYIMHPDYNHMLIKNDIGFLVTSANVELSDTVSLVALDFNFVGAGVATTAVGWGITSAGSFAQVLLQLSGTVIEGSECVTWVAERAQQLPIGNPPPVDPHLEICAYNSNGRGMCNGDSGSPLVRANSNQQIGLVSWGIPCAHGAPDMFVRLSAYRSFIEQSLT